MFVLLTQNCQASAASLSRESSRSRKNLALRLAFRAGVSHTSGIGGIVLLRTYTGAHRICSFSKADHVLIPFASLVEMGRRPAPRGQPRHRPALPGGIAVDRG